MPRRRPPPKLENLCFETIAKQIPESRVDWISNDFRNLPSSFIEKLFRLMKIRRVRIPDSHLDWLIHPRVKKLNFSDWSFYTKYSVTVNNLLIRTAGNLTHLELTNCDYVSLPELIDVVQNIPNIKDLNLEKTKCNDFLLGHIGTHCPSIQTLNVSLCDITDQGIRRLCLDNKNTSRDLKISVLSIQKTHTTEQGSVIAFKYLKYLKLFFHDYTEAALILMHSEVHNNPGLSLALENFQSMGTNVRALEAASIICPNIRNVFLASGFNNDLRTLCHFQNIVSLSLGHWHQSEFTIFTKAIMPVLKAIGKKLVELKLTTFKKVDILAIGFNCPNLVKLRLSQNKYTKGQVKITAEKLLFSKLRHLVIECSYDVPVAHLDALLMNCDELTSFKLIYCSATKHSLLCSLVKSQILMWVTDLKLSSCRFATPDVIINLLEIGNKLKCIGVTLALGLEDRIDLKNTVKIFIKKNNFDVKFDVFMDGTILSSDVDSLSDLLR